MPSNACMAKTRVKHLRRMIEALATLPEDADVQVGLCNITGGTTPLLEVFPGDDTGAPIYTIILAKLQFNSY